MTDQLHFCAHKAVVFADEEQLVAIGRRKFENEMADGWCDDSDGVSLHGGNRVGLLPLLS